MQDGQPVGASATFQTPANYYDRSPPPDFSPWQSAAPTMSCRRATSRPTAYSAAATIAGFGTIAVAEPDLMLWVGNTAHLRRSDFTTQSGVFKRYSTARTIPELASLLATIPHYATWGDTDYSTQHAGRSYVLRQYSETAFKAFWPQPVQVQSLDGIATRFRYADADFFVLDVAQLPRRPTHQLAAAAASSAMLRSTGCAKNSSAAMPLSK